MVFYKQKSISRGFFGHKEENNSVSYTNHKSYKRKKKKSFDSLTPKKKYVFLCHNDKSKMSKYEIVSKYSNQLRKVKLDNDGLFFLYVIATKKVVEENKIELIMYKELTLNYEQCKKIKWIILDDKSQRYIYKVINLYYCSIGNKDFYKFRIDKETQIDIYDMMSRAVIIKNNGYDPIFHDICIFKADL